MKEKPNHCLNLISDSGVGLLGAVIQILSQSQNLLLTPRKKNIVDYKKLNTQELARLLSPSSDAYLELKERGVLRTKNVVGELGEHYAIEFYNNNPKLPNLSFAPPGVQNVDALSRNGEIYSIKAVSSRKGTTGSFWNPGSIEKNEQKTYQKR